MSAPLLTYSPQEVLVSLAGLHTVGGYVDGTFVKISKNSSPFESQTAMDGQRERLYHHDEGYTLELTLAQSSASNNILSALHNVDLATRKGKFPVIIKDGTGQTSFFSGTSWVQQIPDVTFSNQMEQRTWVIGCADAVLAIGGNGSTSAIEDALLVGSSFLPALKSFGVFGG